MKQNLRRILWCAALAGLPFIQTQAYDWRPIGDAVDANGFATTGGLYLNGDYIGADAPNPSRNNNFTATNLDSTLNLYGTVYFDSTHQVPGPVACSLKVNGNVVLDATSTNMTININENVTLEPYLQAPNGDGDTTRPEAGCAQLYFQTDVGTTITVNVNHDLEFAGKTTNTAFEDLLVTFAGRGTTIFNMADGTSVKFNGQIDTSGAQVLIDPATNTFSSCPSPSTNAGGTKAFILMDQTQADVASGKNKVVFQRQSLSSNTNDQRVLIIIGPNSVFTFLSNNPTGLPTEEFSDGYGALGFDPSNYGTGRMVLLISGAYALDKNPFLSGESGSIPNPLFGMITARFPFNDGGLVIAGHHGTGFDPVSISGCALPGEGSSTTPGYDLSTPAGIRATCRVIDNQFYNAFVTANPGFPYAPTIDQRRGLLVVNDVMNHGKLASDPYWDLYAPQGQGFFGIDFAYSNPANAQRNVRKGCVIGVNGELDIYHNTFLDHASGSTNIVDPLAQCDYGDPSFGGDLGLLKKRNPSALIIDGLDISLFINGNPLVIDGPIPSAFTAANPYVQALPVTAKFTLRGSGAVYVKEVASSFYGYIHNLFDPSLSTSPLDNVNFDWTAGLSLGTSTYDGFLLSPTTDSKQSGEGEHVLDVEGPLTVESIQNTTAFNSSNTAPRNYANFVTNAGVVNAASVLIDYTGQEVYDVDGDYLTRPLLADGTLYGRYNSPTLFFNNFASFFNSILIQSDATKFVDGVPSQSEPGVTGGERLYFGTAYWGDTADNRAADPNRFRFPEIQLFNTTLQLQESWNASGVRFVVKDDPSNKRVAGSNTSVIQFFDHGPALDTNLTGMGRVFLCGSSLNLMSDGSNNYASESCFVNVFKHNDIAGIPNPLNGASTATLSLTNGDQFDPNTQALINASANPALLTADLRAHHLFMFSQPSALINAQPNGYAPHCNMVVGWSNNAQIQGTLGGLNAPAGDAGAFPGSFPYPTEPLITDPSIFTSDPFIIDALTTPPAVVSIDGSIICFGSFDDTGSSIKQPVATDNDDGIVYIKHGGKITITRPLVAGAIPGPGEDQSVPYRSVFATILAQRIWNDYNFNGDQRVVQLTGIIDLPHDQVIYDGDKNMGVEPYNITDEMFAARRDDTAGYVRLSFFNPERDRTLALGSKSGANEVIIGWSERELQDQTVTFPGTGGNEPTVKRTKHNAIKRGALKKAQWLTRATESVNQAALRPTDLLYVGAGDDITQMKVAGATMSDPFILDVSGDGFRPVSARVREFVSLKTTRNEVVDNFISEGAHAVLFTEFGGRIGLGSRAWNSNSLNAWNLLGKDYVTICPLGDGVVDLNANLIVADRLALIAGASFGNDPDFSVHRLTFISQEPCEIRIPANGELDLSSFGNSNNMQQISFAGNVRLVFEEGSTLRLPQNPNNPQGVILYFNDSSQLVFEGARDPSVFLPFTDAANNPFGVNNNTAPSANSRTRILGTGQIWLNKSAQIQVNGDTFVGVETDLLTPTTNLTINIEGEGSMNIGTPTLTGGAFQVGNPADLGIGHTIVFNLLLNGPRATVHIDSQGFLGLGAGIINKNGAPNGGALQGNNPVIDPATGLAAVTLVNGVTVPVFNPDADPSDGGWQVFQLSDVSSINVQVTQGIIEHGSIFDGSSTNASLLAIGQEFTFSNGGKTTYDFDLNGIGNAFVRGGGNVMFVPSTVSGSVTNAQNPAFVNVWDFAGQVETFPGSGILCQYSILASGPLLIDRAIDLPASDASIIGLTVSVTSFGTNGKGFTFAGTGAGAAFYNFLAFNPLANQASKKIDIGTTQFTTLSGFTNTGSTFYSQVPNGVQIKRFPAPNAVGGGTIQDALTVGALGAAVGATGIPENFVVVQ